MEKQRKIKIITITALIVAILGLTVAFASLSQVLQINGTSAVESANWDVHIENVQLVEKLGDATYSEPTIEGTKLKDFVITLRKPGDSVKFSFDVKNGGDIDAYLDDIGDFSGLFVKKFSNCMSRPEQCNSELDLNGDGRFNATDIAFYTDMFSYKVYATDTKEELKDLLYYHDVDDVKLSSGESFNITVEVTYKKTTARLPREQVTLIDNTTPIELIYKQYNSEWED